MRHFTLPRLQIAIGIVLLLLASIAMGQGGGPSPLPIPRSNTAAPFSANGFDLLTASVSCCQDLSTGRDAQGNLLAQGAADARWTIVNTGTPAIAQAFTSWPANLLDGAGWIGTSAAGNGSALPGQISAFSTTFNLDPCPCKDYELVIYYAADNSIEFFVNGISIGGGGGFSAVSGPTVNSVNLQSGVNTITAILTNIGGPSGFSANVQVCGTPRTNVKKINISTGITFPGEFQSTPIAYGQSDDEWVVRDQQAMMSVFPAVSTPYPGWLTGNQNQSRWITPFANSSAEPVAGPFGEYWYEYFIEYDPELYENPELSFRFATDNQSVVTLNGTNIASSGATGFIAWNGPVVAPAALFVPGTNLLRIAVTNNSTTPTGLRVSGVVRMNLKKTMSVNISTGTLKNVQLTHLSAEPDWQLVSVPAGAAGSVPFVFSAFSPIPWITAPATSEWIVPLKAGLIPQTAGSYIYELPLVVDKSDYQMHQISVRYSADNNVNLYLIDPDGILTTVATTTGPTVFTGLFGPSTAMLPKIGTYILRAVVQNNESSNGLLVDGVMTAQSYCP